MSPYTSPRTMHWITKVLAYLDADGPPALLRDVLRGYARDKVRSEFFGAAGEPTGFNISRVVFTYLDYLLVSRMSDPAAFRFSYRTSIEHFFPQYADPEQSGRTVSKGCLNLLGNLALVSVGANSKFSNSLPSVKATMYRSTIEQQSPKLHEMAEIARDPKGWGDDEVRRHHLEMVDLLQRDLGITQRDAAHQGDTEDGLT